MYVYHHNKNIRILLYDINLLLREIEIPKLDSGKDRLYQQSVNPLRAKFFRENINIYSHFMSFLHINKTQVVEIPP